MNAKLQQIGQTLLALASAYNPAVGFAAQEIASLFEAGSDLNGLLKDIRDQTEANAPEVMREVEADYAASTDAFKASVAAHQ